QQQRSVEVLIIAMIVKPVYEPTLGNNYDFPCFDQPPQYHIDPSPSQDLDSHSYCMLLARENNRNLEEILRTHMPNSHVVPEGSDDYTEVTFDEDQCLCDHYTAPVTPPPLAYTPPPPCLATMEPLNTFLMRDECSVPIYSPPLPCTDDLEDVIVDIDLPLGEHLDTLSTGDREIDFNPSRDKKN
nr:hypothetical protein [Tanacetum cinerariifolium]